MGFSLTNQYTQNITQIPNRFIDYYMPHANGSFIKVYLYLLRHLNADIPDLTIENMADMLSYTEADIIRAFRYWEKQGVLSVKESEGQITEIALLPLFEEEPPASAPANTSIEYSAESEIAATNQMMPKGQKSQTITGNHRAAIRHLALPEQNVQEQNVPERHTYSPLQVEALKKDSEIESCMSMVEALLGTTLSDSHMQLILYLMSDLGFSLELVITLYETALSRGKSKSRYIEAIALDWAKKGIRTAKEAEEEASSFHGTYKLISKALGIKRALAPAEKAIIDKWETYHFPDAVLEEACSRTVLQSGDTNLNYTAKILEDWHKKGVTSLKDIEDCDKSYFRQKNATASKSAVISRNKFQNFPQREYSKNEFADLEKQLLHQ